MSQDLAPPSFFIDLISKSGLSDQFGPHKTVPQLRESLRSFTKYVELDAPAVERVEDIEIAGGDGPRPARIYIPLSVPSFGPILIFFHGGGFMLGDLETYDPLCRRLAAASGIRVISVDYRLCPEHPFPAGVEDAMAAFESIRDGALIAYGVDPKRLAVGGDSAGGNLAAVLGQHYRDQISFQMLLYPVMQLVQTKKSKARFSDIPVLAIETLAQIRHNYLTDPDQAFDTRVSPLFNDDLKAMPATYLMAAEFDPLCDEIEAYGDKLEAMGNRVERKDWPAHPHGFLSLTRVFPKGKDALEHAAKALQNAFAPQATCQPA
ncbi:alpha/beta hydrolase [Woodsholea maritima]|uniref:alpha/beta hydrolase n=1 Tax=Woodsholea maritima TaxID=240237 RepID=UPI0003778FA6|nr:alpha/beta hydrolase [Woodsholea maritima]